MLSDQDDKSDSISVASGQISRKSKKIKKNFDEDQDSGFEYGAFNQYISESSMIDFGMLSDTFKEENQTKLKAQ